MDNGTSLGHHRRSADLGQGTVGHFRPLFLVSHLQR
jgi:hypothetical protein